VRKLADRPTLDAAVAALREGQRELARVGVTSVHNLEGALAFRPCRRSTAAAT
jgi:predicted amidohydrolase YtcJ